MASISKRVSGSWVSGDERVMKTATDTITTLPSDLYADGNNATVGLVGNMSQSGTPTPDNPIQPEETGERTGNLYNAAETVWELGILDDNGQPTGSTSSHYTSNFTKVEEQTSYYLSGTISTTGSMRIYFYDENKNWISRTPQKTTGEFITPQNCYYIRMQVTVTIESTSDWMLNTGSTVLPYEPYGYKIPISSANTTTPIYLGEVETTRKIYKQIITGNENTWRMTGSGRMAVRVATGSTIPDNASCYCSHFKGTSISSYSLLNNGECSAQMTGSGGYREIGFYDSTYTSVDDFKTYIQQQYAAGTPVTVWYVLATPTTGIVNEPIRKIGDYADTVSGITIPTITGKDTFDVLTTLKPSEVSLSYTGWHTVMVHEKSKNLFDKSTAISGERILARSVIADATVAHSDYIDVMGISNLAVSHKYTGTNFYFYSDKTNDSIGYVNGYTADVPTGAKYCRINIQIEDLDNTMLNTGSSALPYEPYWT